MPNGKTLAEATIRELHELSDLLFHIAVEKAETANANSRRLGDGIYEVLLDGKCISEVRRRRRGWCSFDVKGHDLTGSYPYATRARAGRALIIRFA
jgi:hypothetical protein